MPDKPSSNAASVNPGETTLIVLAFMIFPFSLFDFSLLCLPLWRRDSGVGSSLIAGIRDAKIEALAGRDNA
jgi:hypothetical protein